MAVMPLACLAAAICFLRAARYYQEDIGRCEEPRTSAKGQPRTPAPDSRRTRDGFEAGRNENAAMLYRR
jgi:hypothetical protein